MAKKCTTSVTELRSLRRTGEERRQCSEEDISLTVVSLRSPTLELLFLSEYVLREISFVFGNLIECGLSPFTEVEENMWKSECGNYDHEDGEIFIVNPDVTLPYIVRIPSIIIL